MKKKNGHYFVTIVNREMRHDGVWDPYAYKASEKSTLGDYATIAKVLKKEFPSQKSQFQPIEYKDIPTKNFLTFNLMVCDTPMDLNLASVGETELLFGTMRAYLGNVLVTPKIEWVSDLVENPYFQLKSEFVRVKPHDGLVFFWLAYLKSQQFLNNLPLGGGGTRPRLSAKTLSLVEIDIPPLEIRQNIHNQLVALAKDQWYSYAKSLAVLSYLADRSWMKLQENN